MINELYSLSRAMEKAGVQAQNWHREYKPIANIEKNKPCVRILISDGKVIGLTNVGKEIGAALRKFGSNQGSYPCMNLASLYRITDDAIIKELSILRPEDLNPAKIDEIKSWCQENNWGSKFQRKYKVSMENIPAKLLVLVPDFKF